ncbi:MAG TPA: hypothetical protein VK753_05480 [Xanthomonadaceae bacterium]|jgi:hypothetical protein|nr:hypothetical protein [Xanthomonadaceae bacterium]
MRHVLCLLVVLLLCACSQQEMIEKFASPQEQATAKGYIDRLRARDFGPIESAADPSVRGPNLHATLTRMADMIPAQEPTSVKLVGAQTNWMAGVTRVNLTYEYDFAGKWMVINVAVRENGGAKTIVGFNVYPESQSLESQNRFTFSGKSAAQYLILAMAIVAVLLTFYSLVACVRTKLAGRKWPWIVFILFGVGSVAVNWSTGEWSIRVLFIQLFSASAIAQPYGPWIISASIPVGAIVFLIQRKKLRASVAGS